MQLLLEEGLRAELCEKLSARRVRAPGDSVEQTDVLRSRGDHIGSLPSRGDRYRQHYNRRARRERHEGEITSTRAVGHGLSEVIVRSRPPYKLTNVTLTRRENTIHAEFTFAVHGVRRARCCVTLRRLRTRVAAMAAER